jgi:ATP-dependent DNA helicase RecG
VSAERLAMSAADLDDLDLPALRRFLERRAPTLMAIHPRDEVGIRLGLLAKVAPRVVPSLVGLYAFGALPQAFFPEWGVVCLDLRGTTLRDEVAAQLDLEGPLPALLEGTMRFLAERNPASELPAFDERKAREAIVNALVHRDLRKTSRVAVRLFADRMEVWSPGGPPEGLSDLEDVARDGGVSQPRNPVLASVARALGIGEQIGRGLPILVHERGVEARVELRTSPREVTVVIPARWKRSHAAESLS